jgi:20S proteasome, alpha and beta subunits
MSVILGYQSEELIILAADNRLSQINDIMVSDESQKIIVINGHLAISFSGNKAVQTMFQNYANQMNDIEEHYVEDALLNIETLFLSLKLKNEVYAQNILSSSSCFIVAGKNKQLQNVMYAVSYVNGKLSNSKTEIILFPPSDLDMKTCSDIYLKYVHTDFEHCMEKTIKEISNTSKVVSSTGDIWSYNLISESSEIKHFY